MTLPILLLTLMLLTGLYSILAKSLVKAAIGLGALSAVLTILMFTLASPLAAVFELSVCAGLITVVFVSVISMTKPAAPGDPGDIEPNHYWKYLPMVILAGVVFCAMRYFLSDVPIQIAQTTARPDVGHALWELRKTDIFAQLAVLFVGIYGVIVFFKELNHDE